MGAMAADQMLDIQHLDTAARVSGEAQAVRRAEQHHTVQRLMEGQAGRWPLYNTAWVAFKRGVKSIYAE